MAETPSVTVRVPGLLGRFTDGQRTVSVRATTVAGSVAALLETYPALEPHLLDGNGELRRHVTLLHEGSTLGGLGDADRAVKPGDEVVLLQAVSGGARPAG